MTRAISYAVFAVSAACLAAEEPAPKTDGELWNEGVDQFLAGDVTNALRTLRPLTLSRSHGARAAEIIAKIEYDASRAEGAADPLSHLEEAARAAQIALRANPGDPRANRNFTRATDAIPSLRETKRINAAIAAAKDKDPAAAIRGGMTVARALLAGLDEPATNGPAAAISRADAAAARADAISDIWIGVKEVLVQAAATNEQAAADISAAADKARAKCLEAATLLGDMNPDARYPLAEAEQEFTVFHKLLVLPPEAMQTDLLCQTNAWIDAAEECGRPWQNEALDYTRSFRAKFDRWAEEYQTRASSDTNMPPFSAEARAEVASLAEKLEAIQAECAATPLPPKQEEALAIIRRILELLPPEKGGGGQSQQQQNKNDKNKDDKNQDDKSNKDKNDNNQDEENQGDDKNDEKDDGGDDQQDEKQDEQEQDSGGEEEKNDAEERELEAVLMKAQERSDEHEAKKKARLRSARLPPNERDW
jgi:hypothetical protein